MDLFQIFSFTITLVASAGQVDATLSSTSIDPLASYKTVYGWKQLDYNFHSEQTKSRLLSTGEFIPPNNVITGIKVYGTKIFLTVPRWRKGIPASLVSVNYEGATTEEAKGPLLNPYPSWELNMLGECSSFQYIQSMEIDQFGRMWIVDIGRVHIFSPNRTEDDDKCPPKLVILDLNTGEFLLTHEFPKDVVSPKTNFLNDIAVACATKEKCYAYISDALDSKIVVYNMAENRSWFVHHSSMVASKDATEISILDGNYTFNVNVDGLTLSPKDSNFDRLYYCPLSSYHLYSVPTPILHSAVNGDNLPDSSVKDEGTKSSQSDGLVMDETGLLFYGLLGMNGIAYYNTTANQKITDNEVLLVQNDIDLQWPDTFGFNSSENSGYLYAVSNRLQLYKGNKYDPTETNFRVLRVYTGSQSYMFSSKDRSTTETIPPALFDATPQTNLDKSNDDKTKYDIVDQGHGNHAHDADGEDHPKTKIPIKDATNSSMTMHPFTVGVLVLLFVTFTLYPAA